MSDEVNVRLFERAAEQIDYWENTLHSRLIQQALDANDLDELRRYVKEAEDAMFQNEYNPDFDGQEMNDVY